MKETAKGTLFVAGGGTGGHVHGGLAVAEQWRKHHGEVIFIGARGGLEEKLVPRENIPLFLLKIGSLKRVSISRRITTLLSLPWAFVRSAWLLIRYRPVAVLGVGGYASGPLVLMARLTGWLWSCKTAVLEQNAIPGFTNRILGSLVHQVFTSFPGTEKSFSSSRVLVTGNPIRSTFTRFPSASRTPFTIFVFGGSQGAHGINKLVLGAVPFLADIGPGLSWIHQSGEKDFEFVQAGYQSRKITARVEKFIFDMAACYRQASLIICRAGASSLFELATIGRASILIPLPTAADNHQEKNARLLENYQAAQVLLQQSSSAADLASAIRDLVDHPEKIAQMEQNACALHVPDSAGRITRALLGEKG